jgi:hypothetical protein
MGDDFIIFENERIRRARYDGQWWYAIVDFCKVFADGRNAATEWKNLKRSMKNEGADAVSLFQRLKLSEADGAIRTTDCATLENVFRILQSLPASKAEPFKRLLARVGSEWIQGF